MTPRYAECWRPVGQLDSGVKQFAQRIDLHACRELLRCRYAECFSERWNGTRRHRYRQHHDYSSQRSANHRGAGAQSFLTDFDNRFTSTPNPFRITDIDAGNSNVQVDLTIGDGAVTLVNSTGVTVTQNPGGNNGVRLTGSVTNINTALASGVNYRTSTAGNKRSTATVSDLGNTGSGNVLTASATVDVEVLDFVPVDIHGQAFIDNDHDHQKDTGEPGIEGVRIFLSGTDFQGNSVNLDSHDERARVLTPSSVSVLTPMARRTRSPSNSPPSSEAAAQATVHVDARGNVTLQSGSLAFGADGFIPEYADLWDRLGISYTHDSGILFGIAKWRRKLGR